MSWETIAYGSFVSKDSQKMDLDAIGIHSKTSVRVRIFPHFKDYKPHGRDLVRDQVKFVSTHDCKVSVAKNTRVQKIGDALFEAKEIRLKASELNNPLWIDCQHPVTLVRTEDLPHFSYSGKFYVRKKNHELEVINIVDLETYLKGVVPSEVYTGWPMETLKTQAVAARTYAVYHLARSRKSKFGRFWDVDDSIAYQAYTGISLRSARTDRSVVDTKGEILTHEGDVIQAYYHADSGGSTEDAFHVWNYAIPYVAAKKEFFESNAENTYNWKRGLSLSHLGRKLRRAGLLPKGESIRNIQVPVAGRTRSGRVKLVSVKTDKGNYTRLSMKDFKKATNRRLPSYLFSFEQDPKKEDRVWIHGVGSGHGVGMSQQGAAVLAKDHGWDYSRILDFYYLDTSLCQLNRSEAELPNCYDLNEAHHEDESNSPYGV